MSTTLRLEVHRITLEKKVRDKKGGREFFQKCHYSELLKAFDPNKNKALGKLWNGFITYFNGEFLTNTDCDKALTTTKKAKHTVASARNIINGEVSGGPTNREQSIFKRKNAKNKTGNVSDDDVVSSDFYIKLWLPYDYESGVLMIQSYSNANVSDLVRTHFRKYIQTRGFRVIISSYFPKSFEEKRKKGSNVVSVSYVKDKLPKGKLKLLNPLFAEYENLNVRIVVSGFSTPAEEFIKKFKGDGPALATDIEALEMKKDGDQNVLTTYRDESGRTSVFKIDEERLRDFSYIYLPEEINLIGKNTYDFNEIVRHTDEILEIIKDEIKYNKK